MKVKIKRLHPNAVIPCYAKPGDAGMDLTAVKVTFDEYGNIVYHTGLAFEIPEGYVGLIFPRSSNCKKNLLLTNSVGVLDSGYRGEVTLRYAPNMQEVVAASSTNFDVALSDECGVYDIGERVGQIIIMPYPSIEFEEAEELSQTERGTGGYGSSGK